MERHLLSYAVFHHFKLGKCFINNCKLCCGVSNKASIYRHITSSNGPCCKHTECSSNEENTEEFLKTCENYRTKKQLVNSKKESNESIVPNCDYSQQELISFDTSNKTDSRSSEKVHLRDSFQPMAKLNLLKALKNHNKKCLSSLVHIIYLNLKENQLLSDQWSKNVMVPQPANELIKKSLNLDETVNLPNKNINCGYIENDFQSEISKICNSNLEEGRSRTLGNPRIKELFRCNMYNKYQSPKPKEAARLSAIFPEAKKLLSAVVEAMLRVDKNYVPHMVVADHLHGCYWKAHLTLSWPHRVNLMGVHPDRDVAIHGAYLFMCEQLKIMGLIFQNKDGSWQPMTCDKAMTMLEMLSKYGKSSLGCSRGKGFKIVLEQSKEGKSCNKENIDDDVYTNVDGTKKNSEDKPIVNCLRKVIDSDYYECGIGSGNENVYPSQDNMKNVGLLDRVVGSNSSILGSSIHRMEIENIDTANIDFHANSSSAKHKPRWICTIHVGWPFPFSVQAEGLSLPAAQIMGYLLAVNKIKMNGLLTSCNSSVSREKIESLLMIHTRKHWRTSINLMAKKTVIENVKADAVIYCDASVRGFGAFLSLKGTQQVSWLSEAWKEHQLNIHQVLDPSQKKMHTMLAELFVVVTAVFTWKHKLRSRRLLCFSDNLIVMGYINSLTSEPLSPEMCRSSVDHLIHTLQTTCLEYSIKLQVTWLDRHENWLADCLARNDIVSFQAAVPKASIQKTKAKKLKIRE